MGETGSPHGRDSREVATEFSEGDFAVIARDIVIEEAVAFLSGESVKVERVSPDPQRPRSKYAVRSASLGKVFLLTDEDLRECPYGANRAREPDEVPAAGGEESAEGTAKPAGEAGRERQGEITEGAILTPFGGQRFEEGYGVPGQKPRRTLILLVGAVALVLAVGAVATVLALSGGEPQKRDERMKAIAGKYVNNETGGYIFLRSDGFVDYENLDGRKLKYSTVRWCLEDDTTVIVPKKSGEGKEDSYRFKASGNSLVRGEDRWVKMGDGLNPISP